MKDKIKNIDYIINIILILIIIFGICTSIRMLIVNRSLWFDEAAFAWSISQRNVVNLTIEKFDWNQVAPIIYIYLVKGIILVFNNSEITLRIISFMSYIVALFITYKVSKKVFKMKYALIPVAYLSTLNFILRYSNEFKPYIFDLLVTLLILYMYYLYNNNKIPLKILFLIFMISIWASNSVCFFIGGILIYEFIMAVKEKNYRYICKILIGSIGVGISFVIYYFFWLKNVADSEDMINYWSNSNFPLIPKGVEDLKKIKLLLDNIISVFNDNKLIIMLFSIISLIIGMLKKDKYKIIIILSVLIALFASYINKFPVEPRIWLFIYPIIIILCFDTLNMLLNESNTSKFITICICLFMIISSREIYKYWDNNNVYYSGEEANYILEYLEQNMEEDEKIYVYSVPVFQYKNGYNLMKYKSNEDNIIYGNGIYYKGKEFEDLYNENKVYILISHYMKKMVDPHLKNLYNNGYLENVLNEYNTPLYFYTNKREDMKLKIKYELEKVEYIEQKYIVTISLENTGKSIINSDFDDIYLASRQKENLRIKVKKNFKQNEKIEIKFELNYDDIDNFDIQLYNKDSYWFDELGIEPLKISNDVFGGR